MDHVVPWHHRSDKKILCVFSYVFSDCITSFNFCSRSLVRISERAGDSQLAGFQRHELVPWSDKTPVHAGAPSQV